MAGTTHRRRPGQPVFFVHVPKTAGTSLRAHLERQFAPHEVFPDELMLRRCRANYPPPSWYIDLPLEARRPIQLLRGHMHYCMREFLPLEPYTVTVLREPVARTLSQLRHVARAMGVQPQDEAEYIRSRLSGGVPAYLSNLQTKFFAGTYASSDFLAQRDGHDVPFQALPATAADLEQAKARLATIDVLGVQEDMAGFMERLAAGTGWSHPGHLDKLNTAPEQSVELDASLLEMIAEATRLDAELHAWARARVM